MNTAHYNQLYYLKIADTRFRVELPKQSFLFDHWDKFISNFLFNFLTISGTCEFGIKFTGPVVRERKIEPANPIIGLPKFRGKTCYVNHLLHPNFFLACLGRLMELQMDKKDQLLLHASGVVMGKNKALLIVGRPGSGKSTTLAKLVPPLKPLADDQVVIAWHNKRLMAYPSPFNSKVDLSTTLNRSYPIAGVIFPEKNKTLSLSLSNRADGLATLLNETLLPLNSKKISQRAFRFFQPLSHKSFILGHQLSDDILELINKQFG